MKLRIDSERRGFTLIELLVVMTIIAILMALLLPAIQAIREAANLLYCQNNMKQLALGCLNYESSHKNLPPAMQFDSGENAVRSDKFRPNWVILILPYIEQQHLHDEFDFTKHISHIDNGDPRGTRIQAMECPTDVGHDTFFAGDSSEGEQWARGNYAANVGHLHLREYNGGKSSNGWKNKNARGVMGWNVSERISRITSNDGASNTMLLGELRVGLGEFDRRGTWAMGTAGASAFVSGGWNGDANGPNPCTDNSDDVEGGNRLNYQDLKRECMTVWPPCPSWQATARSRHASKGVNVALVDGSIHFIGNFIDVGDGRACCSTWDRLVASRDGLAIDANLLGF
ncbi:MAG: DUF1559 domain-containing protein [Planctomycetales bacterium]